VWDEYKQEEFDLRALMFMTINDWPGLSNLLGQTNKGYNACTHCLGEINRIYLDISKKMVYLGHHRFLSPKHSLRKQASISMVRQKSGASLNTILVMTYLI
jgi:hypothetical protein